MPTDPEIYRNGPEGFFKWVEDNVRLPVYPKGSMVKKWTPFSQFPDEYLEMWDKQKYILREGLAMENGTFKYALIILMWPRGEGKSVDAVLIKLWRFFNFPAIKIILGANSVGQIRFMHFEEMLRIISNSPKLLARIGKKNLLQRQIQIRNKVGDVVSYIRPVSSFSGLYSGIDGYTFSEFHQARDTRFFEEIDSSMRGIKNGLGVIDTTVASKVHILHKLWQNYQTGKDKLLFFSYRQTTGKEEDFWNPEINQDYLETQKSRLPFGGFERFFLNSWEAASEKVFSDEIIEATNYLGVNKQLNVHNELIALLERKNKYISQEKRIIEGSRDGENPMGEESFQRHEEIFRDIDAQLWPIEDVYRLKSPFGLPQMATADDLEQLGNLYDTDWAILTGADRADPMKTRTAARTIVIALAKGLMGSRTNPYPTEETGAPRYLYLLLGLWNVEDHSLDAMKDILLAVQAEFEGIDSFGAERWGIVDIDKWANQNDIACEIYYPGYDRQRTMFSMLYLACKHGLFKTPPLAVPGSKEDDIWKEEAMVFDHVVPEMLGEGRKTGKFGSPEKSEKHGRQDDAIYAIGATLYGGRLIGVDKFRPRKGAKGFGMFFPDRSILGRY